MSRRQNKCVDKTPIEPKLFRRFNRIKWIIWLLMLGILIGMLYRAKNNPTRTVGAA